jgi:hypothetical protein
MARGKIRPNGAGRVDRDSAFGIGRDAVRSNMLPLPPSEKSANDFNEGYDYEESRLGIPAQDRNTFPKGQ